MGPGDRPITVALLGTPDVSAATLYGFVDTLAGTRRDWQMLHGGPATPSPFRPLVVSADGRPFAGGNGVRITPDASFADCPRTRWHAERGLVVAGPGGRVLMAGSGVAWHMLALALIARFASPEDAMRVARINLLDLSQTSPLAFASLTRGGRADDPLVARCQLWAAQNYRVESPVARMVALSGLPERTFKRRFVQATGMSPLDYVHTLRLEEAKQMLEAGDLPVEAIALEVGYQDASFFGRLFRRKVALTPAQWPITAPPDPPSAPRRRGRS